MKIYSSLIFLLSSLLVSFASGSENSNDFWLGTFTKKSISKNYSIWTEAQMRHDLDRNEMQQTLFRTGLLRSLSNGQGLGLLYAYIETGELSEHRVALQHTQAYGTLFGTSASHRIRLEARRFENNGFGSARFRYLGRLQGSKEKGSFTPVVWDEVFLNAREEARTGNNHLDRNRLFLGFRKSFKESDVAIEFGYLNQFVPRDSGDLMEHILVFYLFL